MIFSSEYLKELRKTGINSQNLKNLILSLAAHCQKLEAELKGLTDGDNTEGAAASSNNADG